MTREEIEKKAYEVYPEIREEHTERDINAPYRKAYIKGLTEQLDCPKIKGWVARGCDGLTIYAFRPKKGEDGYYVGKWIGEIEDSFAPEMTREDEPIEVELTIKKI